MGIAAFLLSDAEPCEQSDNNQQKVQSEIWWKLAKLLQRRRRLKITRLYTCI